MGVSVHSSIGKRVVAKVTPYIATERPVAVPFNLQAVSGHFPALRYCGKVWVFGEGRERHGVDGIDVGRMGET